ncbi:hypothetical protein llap_17805 [Limosa lapponica baueri]|uniref:Dystonin n=1 Tax=Limosa lapponica baueri TaxID=1758121 RepID=A0A2I0TDM1_LIMLA|nr:hypothetical protein llap_17805 [Limosa lapponica baueri]
MFRMLYYKKYIPTYLVLLQILKNKEASVREAYSDLMAQQNRTIDENTKLMGKVKTLEEMLEDMKKQKSQVEQELPKVREAAEKEQKKQQKDMEEICLQKTKAEQEAKQCRVDLENVKKEKADAEQQLECVRQLILQAETQRGILEENLRAFRNQVEESTFTRRNLEEHLRRKDTNLQDLEQQKKTLMQELKKKTEGEEKLMKLIKQMEQDLEFKGNLSEIKLQEKEKTEARRKVEDKYSVTRETSLPTFTAGQGSHCRTDSEITSFQKKLEAKKVDELKQKIDELTLANKKADKTIKDLKYELNEIELQKTSTEEKSRLIKEKLDKVNSELKCLKIKLEEKDQAEQGYLQQLKELDKQLHRTTDKAEEVMQEAIDLKKIKMNYQEELKSVQQEKTQLRREVEELTRSQAKAEITIRHLNSQISSLQKEKLAAEHRTQSCKGEANNLQDQYKKIQEQLLQKTKVEKENHREIQMLKNELAKSNQMSGTLKREIEDLNKWNTETKLLMKQIQSESEKMTLEKQSIQKKNDALKALADGFKEQLRTTNEQLHKQTIIEQEFICKIKSLEVDLAKAKDLASEYKQKCDKQSASTLSIDREVQNLNAQMSALAMEKRMNEQKIQLHQAHIQELSSKLKKLQDELHQKTLDEQMARKKMILFQEESIKFKHSAEEFRKKVEKLLESHSIKEKDVSGIKLECIALQQEKHMAEENVMFYKIQMEDLQERLKKCQEQLQQGKQAEMDYHQKCRKLEEELEVQKRTVESLKQKMDLQVKESEHRFLLVQNEVQQNNRVQDSGFKLNCERRGNDFNYLSDAAAREFDQLLPHAKPSSPLLRQKQERSGFKSDQIEENTLYVSTDDAIPREVQFQMSRINQSLEEDGSPQSFTEFVSQTSTEFQITFDKASQISGTSERDRLRNRSLHSSRQTIRHGEDLKHELGVVKLHPLEIVKNKQYDMHVEVTTLNQEKDKTFGNEERMFEGYKTSEGFRREDFAKMSSFLGEEILKTVDDAAQLEYFTEEYDDIKFQGLRHDKSMAEEKKEHVEKAGDLLKWVSNLSKTLSQEEGEKAEKTDLPKQQGIQQVLTEHSHTSPQPAGVAHLATFVFNRMTDEERNEMEKQVRSLQESYSLLSNEALKQLQEAQYLADEKMEEKVNKVIAGVIDQTTGEVLSVFQSILKGFIDYDTGIRLLENQLILSGIISPELGTCYDLEEAKARALIDEQTLLQLQELSNAKKLISESSLSNLPVVSALEQGLISEPLAIKILENQLSSGHLILPSTGENLTLQSAFQRNLISPTLYTKLLERQDTCKDLIDPNCAEKISLEQMVHRSVIHEKTGLRLLPVKPQEKGRITFKCGRKITILRAAHEGLIDRETMFRLLGAQLMSGGIVDPDSGKRVTVEEAMRQGMIDQDTACGILTHQVQTGGILCPNSGQRLTVDEAVQCNLISSTSALLVLEAQRGFVGLIWPHTGEIFPISTSLHQEMITNELAFKILNDRQKIAALYIPETCEIVSLDMAAQSGIIDINAVSILTNVTLPDKMPNVEELESPCKNAAKWLSMYEFVPSVFHDCEEEREDSGTEDSVCHNLDQAKKLFISYLMVNSYMDANTGRRLLLYDGQLQEAISMLLGGDGAVYNDDVSEMEFNNKYINPKGSNLKSTGNFHFTNVTGSVQGDLSGAQNMSNNSKLNQFEDFGNYISLQGEDLHVCRPDVCHAIGTEQSEYTQEMLLPNPTDLRNIVSSTQNSMNRNALRGLPEVSEWTELPKCNSQKANSGNGEGYLPSDSNPNRISETEKEQIYMADSLGNENRNDKTLYNSLSVNDLSDSETWRELERCTKCRPHISQDDNSRMVLDNSKKDDFQGSLGSSIGADTEYGLPEELVSQCGDTLQFEDNGYSRQPLQDYTDVHSRLSLEDYLRIHGRPSLEDCTDLQSKLCLEDSGDAHCRPSLGTDTIIHDGSPMGDSGSTAEESDLTFDKLLLCDSSSDSSVEGGDGIPQFESNCLQHERGEIASEDDSSPFDDDDVYETPQVDDDDSDVYDSSQIDDDDSYGTPQGDDGFDTLQLRDDDVPEPELSGTSVPLAFLEERGGLITPREETGSFQELAANVGGNVHVDMTGLPESVNTASAGAETMERIPEEERERTGSFGEKLLPVTARKLPVTPESEQRKEGGLSSLWKTYEAEVRDRTEEDEIEAESDSYEDESEGTQEEEDYDSYDDSDTDSDSDEELDIFYSHHRCINKGDQLLISLGDIENRDENNQDIDDSCYSLSHKRGYTLQSQSSHENGEQSSGRCESASDVSEERCTSLPCTSEDEYGTCVRSKHMSQDTTEPLQSENTFDSKWMSCKSEENNKTQLEVRSSQLLGDIVTSDISVTAFPITKQHDDESTQTNLLLSECFIHSVNKTSSTTPTLHSNNGQRQREAVFAEEKVLRDMAGMEQLKESASQMDNKFLADMPFVSDGDSALSDQVHPVTSRKHGQVGRGFEILTENKNRVNIMEECGIMGQSKSPIQMESLGEIFDASVIKADRETPVSTKEQVKVDQALLDIGGSAKSDEFMRDFNISTSLKRYITDVKEGRHSELDKTESCCFEDRDKEKCIQNEKDFLLNTEEVHSSPFNTYSFPPADTVKPNEISITEGTGRGICQNTDNVLKDFSETKGINDSEFSPIKAGALGGIEDAKESGEGSEMPPSGSRTHTTDVSSAIVSSTGADGNYGAQKEHEALKNTQGENFMASETSSLGSDFKKQMSVESLQKEFGSCKDFQVKESISQLPEMTDTLMEDLRNILQRKLKMGHVYCKQEGEPLSYSDTKVLMQNLFKMVRSTQLQSDTSSGSNLKQISNAVRTALMVTTACAEAKDRDALPLPWPDCKSPDLLCDILKQESCKQKMDDPGERKSGTDVKAPGPKLTTSELLEIFQISPGDESPSKLEELISGLLTSSQVADINTECEGKGKVDGLCTLFSTEQSAFGSGTAEEKTLADDTASAWKSAQEHGKTDSLSKGFTEPVFKRKEVVLEDTPTNIVDGVEQCLRLAEKMRGHLAVLQDMKSHLDNQQPVSNNLEKLKDELEQLENSAAELACEKTQLESAAFDVQFFISEHAQDLSPNQSKQLLRLLNATQKSFQEVQEAITSRVESLETRLRAAQELGDQKVCLSV